jgi:nitrous oxide reductase
VSDTFVVVGDVEIRHVPLDGWMTVAALQSMIAAVWDEGARVDLVYLSGKDYLDYSNLLSGGQGGDVRVAGVPVLRAPRWESGVVGLVVVR